MLICAYTLDRLDVLSQAIESVRAQSAPAHEIVLAIDHSPELLAEARRRWPDVRLVENREEQGLSGARNSGVAECSGEVVAFLDDDAVAAPDWLERLGEAYRDPDVLGAGGTVRPAWVEGKPAWFPPEFDWVVGCTHSGMPRQREAVRNLVGANMSLRREALVEVGGFRHELGRVGTIPAGCEETDLCIRVGQRWPEGEILYDPAAAVDHFVPASRGSRQYFTSRCRGEGRSKAVLAGLVGSDSGLEAERTYTSRTLPLGVLRGLGDAFRGDLSGLARAAMIVVGLFTTTAGYLSGGRERAPARAAPRGGGGRRTSGSPRVLMVTPAQPPPPGRGRAPRDGSRAAASPPPAPQVEVLCTEPGGPKLQEEERDGVTIRTVRAWPANRDWCLAPRIWREMSRQPWDVVHVQSYHTFVAPLAMLRALTPRHPLRRHLPRRRPLLGRAQQGPRPAARAAAPAADAGGAPGRRRPLRDRGVRRRARPAGRSSSSLIPNGTDLAFSDAGSGQRPARRAAGDRLDRPARALQGPSPRDRRLPLRAE